MKPSRNDPADPEDLCIFQSPRRWKEARVEIPMSWVANQELDKIQSAVLEALEHAQNLDFSIQTVKAESRLWFYCSEDETRS